MGRLPGPARRLIAAAAATAALLLVGGCGLIGGPSTAQMFVPAVMHVTSPDYSQRGMSAAFSCHGAGRNPAIHWSGAPRGTKSFALVMDDSDTPFTPYIYWIVYNIGPQTSDIPVGELPHGARQAANSKGTIGYDAPCPPNRSHYYRFTVYALSKTLRLGPRPGLKTAWSAIAAAAKASGRLNAIIEP